MVIWLGVGPSRLCLRSPASAPAAGARRLVGPAGYRLLGRQAGPTVQGLVGGWLLLLNLGDEGFAEVAWLQCCRPTGVHCSLTASCLLNGVSPSRGWQAGWREPAPSWADWGRPGRLQVSLCLKGPTARGPYW